MLLSREAIITPIVALTCMVSVSLLQVPKLQKLLVSQESSSIEELKKDEQKESLRLELLETLPSFTYKNLISDWVYIDFLQYFGDDQVRDKIGYSISPEYFDIILTRDPRFLEAYLGLSVSTSLYAGMPEKTISIMENNLKSLSPRLPPRSYYIWRYKGTDELLFMGNAQKASQSFSQAANWASTYNDEESKNVVSISRQTAAFLSKNPASKAARVATWTMVLQNKLDEKTQKRAIKEIEALGGQLIKRPDGSYGVTLPEQD
ncbi:hypothetical protein H6F32_00375 [Anabaena sp. FACHB-1237]|uniref:hypothetical protein n=1 Tax=Anabaena sp. FACHB-1237 TaxID=2692769 RepID=UPI0016810401|nr:hypothetical protein [Anabaena sp. FACHB-1237]MBD2136072.1 hypothetical protein [Anabaena sp. FACHB-1237]